MVRGRLETTAVSVLAALLPAPFRERQRAEWTADLALLDSASARRRYLFGAARTLPRLHAAVNRTAGTDASPPVARILVTAAILLLGSPLLLTMSGHRTGPLETRYELTGEAGVTARATVTSLDDSGTSRADLLAATAVPWNRLLVVNRGDTALEATPSRGILTCRIVVENAVVTEVTGAPGQKVTCRADVDESPITRMLESLRLG